MAREIPSLREFLPFPAPDLSPEAVALWPASEGAPCPRCGAFSGGFRGAAPQPPCAACAAAPPPFDAARSLFVYSGDVRSAIVASKYSGRPFPALATARRLREALYGAWKDLIPDGPPPVIVPIPVHPWKYFRRGFNLPALIGARLAPLLGWPFDPLVLARNRQRIPQAGLRLPDRLRNAAGAFRVPPGRTAPPRVLLLDDVYTSGATARDAACALKTGGADHIVVVTAARAVL